MKKIVLVFFIFHFSFFILNAQHYVLYGEAATGGQYGDGVLFQFDPFTERDTVLFDFNGHDGNAPARGLCLDLKGILYGACEYGGDSNNGVLFSYNLLTNSENTITNFIGSNGANPFLCAVMNKGDVYGTTGYGGKYGGVIFKYIPVINKDTVVFNFNDTIGLNTYGGLFVLNDTSFYGMTGEDGLYNVGTIYRFNPVTNKGTVLFNFNGNKDGAYSQGTFIKGSNGLLYGMTADFGPKGGGVLLSFNPVTNTETDLVNFNDALGLYPFGDLFLATDSLLYGMTAQGGKKNAGVLFSYNVKANKYSIVINFDSLNGLNPDGGDLIEDTTNKILYGMTLHGGIYNDGVIFSYNLITKKDSVLFNFDGTHGANPQGTLLMVPDSLIGLGVGKVKGRSEEVSVYPNPSNGTFTLVIASEAKQSLNTIEVYNVLGENIYQAKINSDNTEINISGQPNGVYLYRVISENGELLGEGKIIVQK